MAYIYGIQSGLFIKIGVAGSLAARLRTMNLYNPHPCKVVMKRQVYDNAFHIEKRVHRILAPYSIGREWFAVDARLVRAAVTVAAKEYRDDQIAWQLECARRAAAKRPAGALEVQNASRRIKKTEKSNA